MTVIIKSTENKIDIQKALKKLEHKGRLNVYEHLGVLKLKEDPLQIQKRMRDEW
jgi:hypothetical protein